MTFNFLCDEAKGLKTCCQYTEIYANSVADAFTAVCLILRRSDIFYLATGFPNGAKTH